MVAKGGLILGAEHSMQYIVGVLSKCTFEVYIILLTSVAQLI